MASGKDERIDLDDFGFYDPDGIGDWADAYLNSNLNPGHLPRPGGLRNQTLADKHDLAIYLRGVAWAKSEKESDRLADELLNGDLNF